MLRCWFNSRKFAAQLAVKEKHLPHEVYILWEQCQICVTILCLFRLIMAVSMQDVKPSINQTITHQSSDCIIIDAEDYNASYDHDVPMYVHHTEAMLEEIDRMVLIFVKLSVWLLVKLVLKSVVLIHVGC